MIDIIAKAESNLLTFSRLMYPGFIAPPYMRKIAEQLEAVERGDIRRLILTVPPRHGKSLLASQIFPAYFLGKHPRAKIMLSSHTQMLASDFGRNVRNFMQHPNYKLIFPGVSVSDDRSAMNAFSTTQGGEAFFMGVGGALLGRGADCFPAGTLIQTEQGVIDIAILCTLKNPPRVLSFNHKRNIMCYQKILATRKIQANALCKTTTKNGRTIISTPDHRFYSTDDNLYLPIQGLNNAKVSTYSSTHLPLLSHRIQPKSLRISKEYQKRTYRLLLQSAMLNESSRHQESTQMRTMWAIGIKENKTILRYLQNKTYTGTPKNAGHMLYLPNSICNEKQSNDILREGLCKSSSFATNDRCKQFTLQDGQELCKMVRRNETVNYGAGLQRVLSMSNLRNIQKSQVERWTKYSWQQSVDSSYRSQSGQQYSGESYRIVSDVSSEASSLQSDTISSVEIISKDSVDVYDIQVEGTNNFFANEILVHNCAIIDDPVKDAEQADSETYIAKLRNWYRETLYTRQMSGGRIIIIMQRWRANDLIGWLLDPSEQERVEDWKVINFPAIAEEDDVLGREPGEALWPEKFPVNELEGIRSVLGSRSFNGLYQQKPSLDEGAIFKREWFHIEQVDYKLLRLPVVMFLDTAQKEGKANDYSSATWGARYKNGIAVLGSLKGKFDFPRLISWTNELAWRNKISAIVIEDKSSGTSLAQSMKKTSKIPVIAMPIKGKMDKEERAHAVTPLLESGKVIFDKWLPQITQEDLFSSLLQFPTGSHDDDVDSLVGLLTYLSRANLKNVGRSTTQIPSIYDR
jgi:predicted phage terminase large subunit-like protein